MVIYGLKRDKNKQLYSILGKLCNKQVRAGWINGERYETGASIASVMNLLNNGGIVIGEDNKAISIPPRPFLNLATKLTEADINMVWKEDFIYSLKAILIVIMYYMINNIKLAIETTNEPPLSRMTIVRRMRTKKYRYALDKPLMETGKAYNSIKGEIINV